MVTTIHRTTQTDCSNVIESLIGLMKKVWPDSGFSFLVYGGYIGRWRPGLSDLDAMLLFEAKHLTQLVSLNKLRYFQKHLRDIFEKFGFLKIGNFFADVFVLDREQIQDGRFFIHDSCSLKNFFVPGKYQIIYGRDFLAEIKAKSLRNQDEFYLASGLQKLRNYLLFEIPRPGSGAPDASLEDAVKFLRVLPRIVSKILGQPFDPLPEALRLLSWTLPFIDYAPLFRLLDSYKDYDSWQDFLLSCRNIYENELFLRSWLCYELTLQSLATLMPAKSM